MSDSSLYVNSIYTAIKTIADSSAKNAGAATTIECQIKTIEDAGKNTYKVSYLTDTFTAYSNTGATYNVGDIVYVLVPAGDFSKDKVILGSIATLGSTYSDSSATNAYEEVSDNLIDATFDTPIQLTSWYDYEVPTETEQGGTPAQYYSIFAADANLTQKGEIVNDYYENYKYFKLSASFRTNLIKAHQQNGNYGIQLSIPIVKDDGTKSTDIVVLDVDSMLGSPFLYSSYSTQSIYFILSGKYDCSDSIKLLWFSDWDINDATQAEENDPDIFIKDISLKAVYKTQESDNTGYRLILTPTEGIYYTGTNHTTKTLTPKLKLNGKETTITSTDEVKYYWFVEDLDITSAKVDGYSTYGGKGWKCLNTKTNIKTNEDGTTSYAYVTTDSTWKVSQDDVTSATRYKCAIITDENTFTAIITLKNLQSDRALKIVSDSTNNQYVANRGQATFTIYSYIKNITNSDDNLGNIVYSWSRYDTNNSYIENGGNDFKLVTDSAKRTKYDINSDGVDEDVYSIQYTLDINKITDYNTVYCCGKIKYNSSEDSKMIGVDHLAISTTTSSGYNVVINNADKIYKYDADGNSPLAENYSGAATTKIESIDPLSFTLVNPDGTEFTDAEYTAVSYIWAFPKEGLIDVSDIINTDTSVSYSSDDDFYYIKGTSKSNEIAYTLVNRYNDTKANLGATLKVTVGTQVITSNIPIYFIKDGASGTNGTSYSAILVAGYNSDPDQQNAYGVKRNGVTQKIKLVFSIYDYNKDKNDSSVAYPGCFVTDIHFDEAGAQYANTITTLSNLPIIYPKVYCDGEALSSDKYSVKYTMFDSKVTNPCVEVSAYGGGALINFNTKKLSSLAEQTETVNIVQAQFTIHNQSDSDDTQVLYAYYPIELLIFDTEVSLAPTSAGPNDYRVPTVNGGFYEVLYNAEGVNPSYDSQDHFYVDDFLNSEVFTVDWNGQHHLTKKSVTQKDNRYQDFVPDNKYTDGNTLNYVNTIITLNADQTVIDQRDSITTLEQEIVDTQSEIAKLATIEREVKYFGSIFNVTPLVINQDVTDAGFRKVPLVIYQNGANKYIYYTADSAMEEYDTEKVKSYMTFDYYDKILNAINSEVLYRRNGIISKYLEITTNFAYGYQSIMNCPMVMSYLNGMYADANLDALKSNFEKCILQFYVKTQNLGISTNFDEINTTYMQNILKGLHHVIDTASTFDPYEVEICKSYLPMFEIVSYNIASYNLAIKDFQNAMIVKDASGNYSLSTYALIYKSLFTTLSNYFDYSEIKEGEIVSTTQLARYIMKQGLLDTNNIVGTILNHCKFCWDELNKTTEIVIDDKTYNLYNYYGLDNLSSYIQLIDSIISSITEETYAADNDKKAYVLSENGANKFASANTALETIIDIKRAQIDMIKDSIGLNYFYLNYSRPILVTFNRYERTSFNAWDGNKIYVDDDESYLLAPQMGAGYKNSDNSFTGIFMGFKDKTNDSSASSDNRQYGLFGYSKGSQSLFLSANNGSAIFGLPAKITEDDTTTSSGGQIIIDPSSDRTLLFNSAFVSGNGYDEDTGLPTTSAYKEIAERISSEKVENGHYSWSSKAGTTYTTDKGMLIDLTTPGIIFGNDNFRVTPTGHLYARGGGEIAGWSIGDTSLVSRNFVEGTSGILLDADANKITLGSSSGKVYSGKHTSLKNTKDGFYIDNTGLSIGSKFKVDAEGIVTIGVGAVDDSKPKHWTIDGSTTTDSEGNEVYNSYIYYNYDLTKEPEQQGESVYIGTDKISLGDKFKVTNDGTMYAEKAEISGTITANEGKIGQWTINDYLTSTFKYNENTEYTAKLDAQEFSIEGPAVSKWTYHNPATGEDTDIDITDGNDITKISPNGLETQTVTADVGNLAYCTIDNGISIAEHLFMNHNGFSLEKQDQDGTHETYLNFYFLSKGELGGDDKARVAFYAGSGSESDQSTEGLGFRIRATNYEKMKFFSHFYEYHFCYSGDGTKWESGKTADDHAPIYCSECIETSSTSDIRYKTLEPDYISKEISKDIVTNITPIAYHLTADKQQKHYRGFSAQEVQDTLDELNIPESIYSYNAEEDKYYLDKEQLIPDLVNCIQDLYEQVNALKEQLKEIKG